MPSRRGFCCRFGLPRVEGCQDSGNGDDGAAAKKATTALGRRVLREVPDAAVQVHGKMSGCALIYFVSGRVGA